MQNDFQNIVRSLWLKLKLTGPMDSKIKLTRSPQIFYPLFFFSLSFLHEKIHWKIYWKAKVIFGNWFCFLVFKEKRKKKTIFWGFQNGKHVWLEEKKRKTFSKIKNENLYGNSFWKSWNFILCEVITTFCLFIICFKVFN